jgi:hypothetical protein
MVRRWLPQLRFAAFMLTAMTVGTFVLAAAAAANFAVFPPSAVQWIGTVTGYIGLPLAAACLLLDRRRVKRG